MDKQWWVGIDPGIKGAVVYTDGMNVEVYPTPYHNKDYDYLEMVNLLGKHPIKGCILEKVSAMPGQGVRSMFTFGMGFGIWRGILAALKIKHTLIHPATWTKFMLKGRPGLGKEKAYHEARRMFPDWEPKFKYEREYADAILLAEMARLEMR